MTGMVFSCKGWSVATLATAMRTRSFDLSVASSASWAWTQEPWLRIFAISNKYGFNPASRMLSWKSGWWVSGVQLATTTRLRLCSMMVSVMCLILSWEQEYKFDSVWATRGSSDAYSVTSSTSRYPPILEPQWQTKTPILVRSQLISFSSGYSLVIVWVNRASCSSWYWRHQGSWSYSWRFNCKSCSSTWCW